jgi:hypothetical protein
MEKVVRVGSLEWTVNFSRDRGRVLKSSNMWVKDIQGKGTRFVGVEGTLVNRGETAVSTKHKLIAVDESGKRYLEMADVAFFIPYWVEPLAPRELKPGRNEVFGAMFEVREEFRKLRLCAVDLADPGTSSVKLIDITPEFAAGARSPGSDPAGAPHAVEEPPDPAESPVPEEEPAPGEAPDPNEPPDPEKTPAAEQPAPEPSAAEPAEPAKPSD